MNNYQLPPDKKHKEEKIIQQILHNNRYDTSISKTVLGNKKLKHNVKKTVDKIHIYWQGNKSYN
jgi:hypothetical protein